jgi:hypothetical protein
VSSDGTWHMICHGFRMGMTNASGTLPSTPDAYGVYAWAHSPGGAWHFQENKLAYDGWVQFGDGTGWMASRRERPKLLLDADGRPTHLYSTVYTVG